MAGSENQEGLETVVGKEEKRRRRGEGVYMRLCDMEKWKKKKTRFRISLHATGTNPQPEEHITDMRT